MTFVRSRAGVAQRAVDSAPAMRPRALLAITAGVLLATALHADAGGSTDVQYSLPDTMEFRVRYACQSDLFACILYDTAAHPPGNSGDFKFETTLDPILSKVSIAHADPPSGLFNSCDKVAGGLLVATGDEPPSGTTRALWFQLPRPLCTFNPQDLRWYSFDYYEYCGRDGMQCRPDRGQWLPLIITPADVQRLCQANRGKTVAVHKTLQAVLHDASGANEAVGPQRPLQIDLYCAASNCDPLAECSGTCVDTASSSTNCGRCGNVCPPSSICSGGQCVCAYGTSSCAGACVSLSGDQHHCGACGHACGAGTMCCSGACVDPSGPQNCGGCGFTCGPDRVCSSGVCCAPGLLGCPGVELGACVDASTDRDNCGACGHRCDSGYTCKAGRCVSLLCGGGFCGPARTCCGGKCINTMMDPRNCGACRRLCRPGTTCIQGRCAPLPPPP